MFVEAWLPQGPDAEDVALITVEPEEAKLWDSTSSNLIYAGKVLKAVVTQRPPDGGKVEEVHMGGGSGQAPGAGTADAYDRKMRDLGDAGGAPSLGGPAA